MSVVVLEVAVERILRPELEGLMREEEMPQGFPLLVVMPLNELKLWGTIGFVVGRRVGLLALVSERRGCVRELSASV